MSQPDPPWTWEGDQFDDSSDDEYDGLYEPDEEEIWE